MKKLLLLPVMALGLLIMQGTALAGPKVDLCHCPPGHNGTKCNDLNISENAANNGHLVNHSFDHLGACTAAELVDSDSDYSVGSGTDEEGFSNPKAAGSNWREE